VLLSWLETFCAVAELGSLTRAADHLNLTQPAVTRQLRALERQLGAVLVTRTPHGVTLTSAGEAVLPRAHQALTATRACQVAAASAAGSIALRIAAGLMATLYVLPPVMADFRAKCPEVGVDLQPADQRVAVERLLDYTVDVAVIASPVRSPQVRSVPILHDPLLLVSAPAEDDASSASASLEQLHGGALLMLPASTGLHEQIEAVLRRRRVACHLVEYPTAETIKTAVALGMGSTILPASAVREEVAAKHLSARPIADWPGAERIIHVLVRAEGRPPQVVDEFITLLRGKYSRTV
jgi:DNA-binding transcriptional LysR family regulator